MRRNPNAYAAHLERYVMVLRMISGRAGIAGTIMQHSRGPRFCSLGLRLRDPLQLDRATRLANPVALAAGSRAVLASRLEDAPGLVTFQFELKAGLWQSYTRGQLEDELAIGIKEARIPALFSWENNPHAGVFGGTGSGKTETVKTILHALASAYTPQELGIIILDRHHDYDEFRHLQHLELPVAGGDTETDLALEWVGNVLTQRTIANERDGKELLLVVDEAANVLEDKRRMAIVRSIGEEARKFRIHLLVSTQKPNQRNLPDLLANVLNRYVGAVDNAQASVLLTGKPGLSCHKLTGKGDFMHVEGPTAERVQVALTTPRDLEQLEWGDEPEMPDVELADVPVLENLPEAKPGRPANELQPEVLAYYLATGPEKISIKAAKDLLGISRRLHDLHKPFAEAVLRELGRLGYGLTKNQH
jgi:hypothetical protein